MIRRTVVAQHFVAHLRVIARALPDSPASPKTPKIDVDLKISKCILFAVVYLFVGPLWAHTL
eukprot:7086954-Heterocapsa_arctica.AAC.1